MAKVKAQEKAQIELVLYTGPQCELCDHALDVYKSLSEELTSTFRLSSKNIRDDSALYHLYAVRIPVMKRLDTQAELGWPFDKDTLTQFLS